MLWSTLLDCIIPQGGDGVVDDVKEYFTGLYHPMVQLMMLKSTLVDCIIPLGSNGEVDDVMEHSTGLYYPIGQ